MSEEGERTKVEDIACDFGVLSNPTRLKLLMRIHEKGPCTLKDLVDEVQRDESTVKRHLKELIDHGFIARTDHKRPKYCVTEKGILAITFLKVKTEPANIHSSVEREKTEARIRARGSLLNLAYIVKRAGFKRIFLYSLSIGCIALGLLGLVATNVEIFFRVLWLILWLVAAYTFKILAS
ncbi:MAG: MarR family transcriptional regulator [Candidatus Nezhaarchaeales archaeon]